MEKTEHVHIPTLSKKVHIEVLRIVACFLVIVNHTNSYIFLNLTPGRTWLCSVAYFFTSKIAVPLFLFIMGGLLLGKEDSSKKTAQRFVRMLIVFVVASFCNYLYYTTYQGKGFDLKEFFVGLPQNPVPLPYWYLYLYLGLLCMLPILQKLAKALNKRQLEYLLFLSVGVMGTVSVVSVFVPSFKLSSYFTSALIGPNIGLVLLGYYMEQYVSITKRLFWGCFCGFILLIAFQTIATFRFYLQDSSYYLFLDSYTHITISGCAACFYICVKYILTKHPAAPKLEWFLCRIGSLTFGIYLLGSMMIAESMPIFSMLRTYMHPLIAMVLWELCIFTVCAIITAVLKFIPPLRKFL